MEESTPAGGRAAPDAPPVVGSGGPIHCDGCGALLDAATAYRIAPAHAFLCGSCYLRRDHRGRPLGVARRHPEILRVKSLRATWTSQDPTEPAPGSQAASEAQQWAGPGAVPERPAEPPRPVAARPIVPAPAPAPAKPPAAAPGTPSGLAQRIAQRGPQQEQAVAPIRRPVPAAAPAPPASAFLVAMPPTASLPLLTALRCALACARTACLLQEYRRPRDHRLRAPLDVLAELATAGQVAAPLLAAAQLSAALAALGGPVDEADAVSLAAQQAVAHAVRAALAVLEQRPWRLVDQHARWAYDHVTRAVDGAWKEEPPLAMHRVAAALAGQHRRAATLAHALWPQGPRLPLP